MTGYGHPDSLVETQWLAKHLNDPSVRIIEVGMSPEDCENAHIPGAVFWSIPSDLMTPDMSMNLDSGAIAALLSRSGISPETTVVPFVLNKDGTFKSAEALHSLYAQQGITKDKRVIPTVLLERAQALPGRC